VNVALFTSQPYPSTDNRSLTISPGFVVSTHPVALSLGTERTYTVTLTAGVCVKTATFKG
jgi:hypothetical protein